MLLPGMKKGLVGGERLLFGMFQHDGLQRFEGFDHALHQIVGLRHRGSERFNGSGLRFDRAIDAVQFRVKRVLPGGGLLARGFDGMLQPVGAFGRCLLQYLDVCQMRIDGGNTLFALFQTVCQALLDELAVQE